jgi:hypothetical protein
MKMRKLLILQRGTKGKKPLKAVLPPHLGTRLVHGADGDQEGERGGRGDTPQSSGITPSAARAQGELRWLKIKVFCSTASQPKPRRAPRRSKRVAGAAKIIMLKPRSACAVSQKDLEEYFLLRRELREAAKQCREKLEYIRTMLHAGGDVERGIHEAVNRELPGRPRRDPSRAQEADRPLIV